MGRQPRDIDITVNGPAPDLSKRRVDADYITGSDFYTYIIRMQQWLGEPWTGYGYMAPDWKQARFLPVAVGKVCLVSPPALHADLCICQGRFLAARGVRALQE